MTLNDLKKMVDRLVKSGHGDEELLMHDDPDVQFDIELIVGRQPEEEDGETYTGVRTNSDF